MNLVIRRIKENGWENAGITGIRTPHDVDFLKIQFHENFVLIHVFVSDPHIRFERVKKRGKERDPKSYQEFLKQDKTEEDLFHISEAICKADYSLNNDGPIHQLHEQISNILKRNGMLKDINC
jgi:dephospho-CoA kinase